MNRRFTITPIHHYYQKGRMVRQLHLVVVVAVAAAVLAVVVALVAVVVAKQHQCP